MMILKSEVLNIDISFLSQFFLSFEVVVIVIIT